MPQCIAGSECKATLRLKLFLAHLQLLIIRLSGTYNYFQDCILLCKNMEEQALFQVVEKYRNTQSEAKKN